ncbi:MAG: hypothetical protein GY853_00265 [PVC group bacterium]|nr:hypothetical protein [PVC group bacterium]
MQNDPRIAKIFEIFQRLEKRKNSEGTGAGLAIVKKIVQMHKGTIWVESILGENTTFYFTIPKKTLPYSPRLNSAKHST